MSLEIKEEPNYKLKIMNSANHLDKKLADDIPEPLPNYSGFNFVIAGSSGSGKTTLLTSLMAAKKRMDYDNLTVNVLIIFLFVLLH